jgi:RHS repeat-associated protein
MTDASGNIVAQYQYDAFGNPTRIAGSGPDSDFLYAGYFYHQPSGLYCTAHRIYNPKLGRWLNRDPIDDDTFAMMPKSPEPRNPSDGLMDAAFGQPINPVATAIAPLLYQTHDPMLRKRLVSMVPQTPGTRMPYTNLYEYAANNPVNFTDPSGLEIGMPRPKPKKPGGTCPAEGPSYEFCRKYCLKICEGSTDPECYLRCMIRCLGIGDDD